MQARIVCKECNSGWMNDIENAAKPYLIPMIEGQVVDLNTDAQAVIALWSGLRAPIGYCGQRHHKPFPPEWLQLLFNQRVAPSTWFIFTTAYQGAISTRFESSEVGIVVGGGDPRTSEYDHGVVTTILIGHLALKVFGFRHATPPKPSADGVLRVWPTSAVAYVWPPAAYLDDTVLEHFFAWGLEGAQPLLDG